MKFSLFNNYRFQLLKKSFTCNGCRDFSQSRILRNLEKSDSIKNEPLSTVKHNELKMDYVPSKIEKIMLKWSGKFKDGKVPDRVSLEIAENAKSRFRIRGSIFMFVGTFLMCGYYIWQGKKLAAQHVDADRNKRLNKRKEVLEEVSKS